MEEEDAAPVDAAAYVDIIERPGRKATRRPVARSVSPESMLGLSIASYRLEQYAEAVLDYSSQYGSPYSISYTASNITRRPTKYPLYGDYPETYAMRTYGKWWQEAPSFTDEIQKQNFPEIPAHDFIVIYFEDYVIPEEIHIYETFSPGACIRIWAQTIPKTWSLLWQDTTEFFVRPPPPPKRARMFSPPLKKSDLPTRIIRLEFNHSRLNYFTEIDAVRLCGRSVAVGNSLDKYCDRIQKGGIIMRKLQFMKFRPTVVAGSHNEFQEFLTKDLEKFAPKPEESSDSYAARETPGLKDMPFEIMLQIFSYLDLASLFRVGQVSRYFYDVSTHPLLYTELNLKPYWHATDTDLLCALAKRASLLKKLDMSWCGFFITISPTEFKKFIQQRGDAITHLRLNSCKFINSSCVETIAIVCDNLKELSLRNLSTDPPLLNFSCLANLKNLERLDLCQTVIESDLLLTMIESNRKLKHLNLSFSAVNMDEVAEHIGNYNKQLISLDLWKSPFFSATGLHSLTKCHELEELDIGWCLREQALGNSFRLLLENCPKLRKLFLAAVRGITSADVQNIANMCTNLEQLDLMGILGISNESYYELLVKCPKLRLLDISFCDNIYENQLLRWTREFGVSIKCSHIPWEPI